MPNNQAEEAVLRDALIAVEVAARGDSNDEEIEALREALDVALDMLGVDRPEICDNCDDGNEVDEHDLCASCLHDAYRSGWEPGVSA